MKRSVNLAWARAKGKWAEDLVYWMRRVGMSDDEIRKALEEAEARRNGTQEQKPEAK